MNRADMRRLFLRVNNDRRMVGGLVVEPRDHCVPRRLSGLVACDVDPLDLSYVLMVLSAGHMPGDNLSRHEFSTFCQEPTMGQRGDVHMY
jgi:hypothetical protein